jgi:hypothetical protein
MVNYASRIWFKHDFMVSQNFRFFEGVTATNVSVLCGRSFFADDVGSHSRDFIFVYLD